MNTKREFTNWRELLEQLIKNSQEKKRLALGADVKPVTLERWAEGTSRPREENLLRLVQAFAPDTSAHFLRLAIEEFPSLAQVNIEQSRIDTELDSEFYKEVLQAYAKTPSSLSRQRLQKLILDHAIEHLDPTKVGMSVALLCCVPPRAGQKVFSLCQIDAHGTSPWSRDLEWKRLFVGAESVAGASVAGYSVFSADSRDVASVNWETFEESAVAAPILRQAKVAGALVVSSSRSCHFTQAHKNLVELYAHLVVLSFSPAEFYDSTAIQLRKMPSIDRQTPYISSIGRRAAQKLTEIQATGNGSASMHDAYLYVYQDVADELLSLAL